MVWQEWGRGGPGRAGGAHLLPRATPLVLLWLAACAGSGDGGTPEAGKACTPQFQREACSDVGNGGKPQRLRCDQTAAKWVALQTCEACSTLPDPVDPTGVHRISVCQGAGPVIEDAGGGAADAGRSRSVDGGTRPGIDVPQTPAVSYTIGGGAATTVGFAAGGTGQQSTNVVIKNIGGPTIVISQVIWSSPGPYFTMQWIKNAPVGPHSLNTGAHLDATVFYMHSKLTADPKPATMTIRYVGDALPEQVLTFNPAVVKGTACAHTKKVTFYDPGPSFGHTSCVQVLNCGIGALAFASAKITQGTGDFSVTTQPAAGAKLPAAGVALNPADNPASFTVCVKVTASVPKEPTGNLRVTTDGTGTPYVDFSLAVQRSQMPTVQWTCTPGPAHALAFNEDGQTLSCLLYNNDPQNIEVESLDVFGSDLVEDEVVGQIYLTSLTQLASPQATEGKVVKLPVDLGEGGALRVDVKLDGGTTSGLPPAILRLGYRHGATGFRVYARLHPPNCTATRLAVAPTATPVALRTAPNEASGFAFNLVNQGCGTLTIKPVCVNSNGGSPDCSGSSSPSSLFTISGGGAGVQVSSDAVSEFPLTLVAHAALTNWQTHWLNFIWCTGPFVSGKCTTATHGQNHGLQVWIDNGLLPEAPTAPGSVSAQAGKPVAVVVAANQQSWALAPTMSWIWSLAKRPSGSTFWLHHADQATTKPVLLVTLDVPGSYGFRVRGRYIHPTDPYQVVWSKPAVVWVSVK